MIGVELNIDASEIINNCIKDGLLILNTGPNVIRFLPPLVITYEEINKGLEVLNKYL